jgi:serine/threonine protein kinase
MISWSDRTLNDIQILNLIGRDAFVETYTGQFQSTEKRVHVKIIYADLSDHPDTLDLLKAEAQLLTNLDHPNINKILSFDVVDGHPFFVHERLTGFPLSDYLKDLSKRGILLPLHVVSRLLRPIASAIDYAHARGVIHRDIVPGNIILRRGPSASFSSIPLLHDFHPVVTNFSIAHILSAPHGPAEGITIATPAYMSPEQAKGGNVDKRSDIYSFGALLYELLLGAPPVLPSAPVADSATRKEEVREAPPPIGNMSPSVAKVVFRAMAKDPTNRYQRAVDLVDDFEEAIRLEPILSMPTRNWTVSPSHPTMQMKKPPKPRRRSAATLIMIIIAIFVLAALCILAYIGWRFISDLGLSFTRLHRFALVPIFTLNLMDMPYDKIQDRRP